MSDATNARSPNHNLVEIDCRAVFSNFRIMKLHSHLILLIASGMRLHVQFH
jgi:hypothetical protein